MPGRGQSPPSSAPDSARSGSASGEPAFHLFALLPTELQVQIWTEAASVVRMVSMQADTVEQRSQLFAQSGVRDPQHARERVPALLHATHQSRQVGLTIYKHRFEIAGRNGRLWETYILADHDILVLSYKAFRRLASRCEIRDQDMDQFLLREFEDQVAWSTLVGAARRGELGFETFERFATPRIKTRLQYYAEPPVMDCFRGNLAGLRRLVLYRTDMEEHWPGLYRDPEVLANLDQAFAAITDKGRTTPLADVTASHLPERYRCRLVSCPHHPGACNGEKILIGVAGTPLDLGQWLKACCIHGQIHCNLGLFHGGYGEEPDVQSMAVWHFSEPPYQPAPSRAPTDKRPAATEHPCAGALRSSAYGPAWQMVTIYASYCNWAVSCRRLYPDDPQWYGGTTSGEVIPEKDRTPGCRPCQCEDFGSQYLVGGSHKLK
ncbi:161db8c3-6e38-437a-9cb2-5dcfc57882d2 [Thermothielavioides terrestris]|uniref:161db8c3-6e38-437a-9cb2-5dcfc57882d2 n=1 Tax=Thermothielavioides terrestris TaxID=2587410 RepID=A0A446BD04_9PEZI|nr:161db8c3-6e38-437a-9cb2-5dcfc57882d2 [Thermothielavioides terrestris]